MGSTRHENRAITTTGGWSPIRAASKQGMEPSDWISLGWLDHRERVPAMSAANRFTDRIVGRSREDAVDIYTCKACGVSATTERDHPECHQCADWSGCQNDRRLSRLTCPSCGATGERSSGGWPT
jgi:hypothetical protein